MSDATSIPAQALAVRAFRAVPVDHAALPSLVCIGATALMFVTGWAASGLGLDARFSSVFLCAAVLFGSGAWLDRDGLHRLGGFLQMFGLFLAFAFLVPIASAALATSDRPYADAALIAADRALFFGFDWPWMVGWLPRCRRLLLVLSYAYASLDWQPLVLLILLCALNRTQAAWRFMTAWSLTLVVCLAVFPWCPAMGAYAYYGLSPHAVPGVGVLSAWNYPKILEGFRDGAFRVIDTRAIEGIVAMPSFHAASALLLAWAFGAIRSMALPFATLNALMLVSSVPIGGHYLVDVAAGSVLAAGAILVATRLHRGSAAASSSR